MNKKIITAALAAALLVSGTAAFAEENVIGAADSVTEISVTEESTAKYVKTEAKAVKTEDNVLTVKADEETEITVSENAAVLNSKGEVKTLADIKEGDNLYIYNKVNSSEASVIIITDMDEDEFLGVDVDTYVKSDVFGIVTNAAGNLALNLDEKSDITDLKGEKVAYTDLENKDLVVYSSIVAMSMPGQTYPEKVIVLGEAETEIETKSETDEPAKPVVGESEYIKTEAEAVKAEENVITVKGEDENTEITVSENVAVLNSKGEIKTVADIKEGDKLYVYSKDDTSDAAVIVIMDAEEDTVVFVDVDKYAKAEEALVNAANTLALNLNEESDITDLNGEKVAYTDVSDKYLAVFYGASTRSIPAQTSPDKVVVLGEAEKEEAPVVQNPENVTKVTADGKEICEVKYDSENKTFMVPVRAIAETLGYKVDWEGGELLVTVGNDEIKVDFKIGVNKYSASEEEAKELEKAPELINDTTFIPCSLFSDILGNTVAIEGDTLAITK